jgi:hypothetical protein
MDKYTKFILTIIAVALFGINYHLFSGDIVSSAKAGHGGDVHKIAICNTDGEKCATIGGTVSAAGHEKFYLRVFDKR